jgi:hypothetical protein
MKKVLALSILLNVVLLVSCLTPYFEGLAVAGGGKPRVAQVNGDTNGDGSLDVSDAVYFLNWLFKEGPELAVIDCGSNQPRSCLVATGQVDCIGIAGLIDCTNPRARGQDAYYRNGCPLEGRYNPKLWMTG